MKRIRYTEIGNDQDMPVSLVSTSSFQTSAGEVQVILHPDGTFEIISVLDRAVLETGSANNPVVLRRKAKNALLKLMGETQSLVKETRKKRL